MQEFSDQTDTAFFIDPPYTAGGKRLAGGFIGIQKLIINICLRSVTHLPEIS